MLKIAKLKTPIDHRKITLYQLPNALPEKSWKQIWPLKVKPSIPNILQPVEICTVLPLSNAEVERVFSPFSKMMT